MSDIKSPIVNHMLEKSFLQLVITEVAFVSCREESEQILESPRPQVFTRFLLFNSWVGKLPNLSEFQYIHL